MLTKTTIAIATALILGMASAALAAENSSGDPKGGFRESGAGAFSQQGINDIYHPDSAGKCKRAYPKSYDPSTMTFVGKDGRRHPCP
jgi:hypothetical protein